MNDLISRQLAKSTIRARCVYFIEKGIQNIDVVDINAELQKELEEVRGINTKEYELRILKNFIRVMPKVYRKRNVNYVVVREILLQGTYTSGQTSCIKKCRELGIDPYGYDLKGAVKDEPMSQNRL